MIRSYNKAKFEARSLLIERNNLEIGDFVNKTVKVDAQLFYLLEEWISDMTDISSFNTKNYLAQSEKELLESYVSPSDGEYANLRIVK